MNKFSGGFLIVLFVTTLLSCRHDDKSSGPVTPSVVSVTSVSISKTAADLEIGNTLQLTATVAPSNATDKTVTWASSNATVATVTPTGLVTAKAEGTANVTATAGGKSAACKVTVKKPVIPVSSVELDLTDITLDAGETKTLKATVNPDNATDKTVTWASTKSSVATVDNSGKVTGVDNGIASVTATSGGKSASCKVTVVVLVKSITLDKTSATITKEKDQLTLTPTITPANAADKSITWTSSKPEVATVSNGVVTAVSSGTTTITANASGKTATCEVTVIVLVESVTLNKTSLSLKAGDSETLVATVNPADATDKTISWNSSNSNVATVDSNGKVTAKAIGTAVITATAGEKTATCNVTVTASGGLDDRPGIEI